MPSAYITLEYVTDKWVCEVEATDAHLATRKTTVVAATIEQAIDQIYEAYRKVVPTDAAPLPKVPDVPLVPMPERAGLKIVRREDRNRSQRVETAQPDVLGAGLSGVYDADAEPSVAEVMADDAAEMASLEALRATAGTLGIEVDGRWGERRLRQEIEARS